MRQYVALVGGLNRGAALPYVAAEAARVSVLSTDDETAAQKATNLLNHISR